jgi:non-reducing end alpha-L-arabinofuranosidase
MTVKPRSRHATRALLTLAAAATLALGGLLASASSTPARAAGQGPCDIYAAAGTPCVAAHSTTRALFGAYNGPLYQVRRASDNATTNISPLSAGGVANAATQDSFCAGTSCVITEIFDQTGRGNNLTQAPGGGAAGGPDNLANATAAPITVGGHKAYGVFIPPGTGYRNDHTNGIATGDASEGEYAIFDGTHFNGGCCFDYGNAETSNNDTGAGHMEAIYFGNIKVWGFGSGNGPWIMADLENGLFAANHLGLSTNDPTTNFRFTTAVVKGQSNNFVIRGGNAQSGGLSTFWNGTRPSGYNPMHKEGAIILGIGGDNSKGAQGTFYEGVMTSGFPSDATENSVQANITAAGYNTGGSSGGATGPIVSGVSSAACMDDNNGSGANGNKVQIWACDGFAPAQNWTVNSNGTITIAGGCLDITGANFNNGTLVELWACNGGSNQQWQAQNGALVNPASGKCLDDPNGSTTNGTQLQIWSCSGASNQRWSIP